MAKTTARTDPSSKKKPEHGSTAREKASAKTGRSQAAEVVSIPQSRGTS
jgi:hypothetical protein